MQNYTEAAKKILDKQREKGLKKYGIPAEAAELSPLQWINHAQEEAADMMIYLESLKDIFFQPDVERWASFKLHEIKMIELSVLREARENIEAIMNAPSTPDVFKFGMLRAIHELSDMIEETEL